MIKIDGIETALELSSGTPLVLEIHNPKLFGRISSSLISGLGEEAVEPYTVWNGNKQVKSTGYFIPIVFPYELPWKDKALINSLYSKIEREIFEDQILYDKILTSENDVRNGILRKSVELNTEYTFRSEFDVKKYLKAFSFEPDTDPFLPFLDNLINFLFFVKDMQVDKPLLFLNLKNFLTEKELKELYEQVFFTKMKVLLLENQPKDIKLDREEKIILTCDFIEEHQNVCLEKPSSVVRI